MYMLYLGFLRIERWRERNLAGNILGARVLHAPRAVCGLVTPSERVCAQSKLGGKASELVGFKGWAT